MGKLEYIVEFDNGKSVNEINRVISFDECLEFIDKYLIDNEIESSSYRRICLTDNNCRIIIDFGSHFQFFYITKQDKGEMTLEG